MNVIFIFILVLGIKVNISNTSIAQEDLQLYSVSGFIYANENCDGVKNKLAKQPIALYQGNILIKTTLSTLIGLYGFDNLSPGITYSLHTNYTDNNEVKTIRFRLSQENPSANISINTNHCKYYLPVIKRGKPS